MHRTDTEIALLDSGLFTQVEPDWLGESDEALTFVNRSRGVVVKIDRTGTQGESNARLFLSQLEGSTYASSGWYTAEELTLWLFPVMRSDRAWAKYQQLIAANVGDLTLALEYV